MKITKTSEEALQRFRARAEANRFCDKCPCCGEAKKHLEYLRDGIEKGIIGGTCRSEERRDKFGRLKTFTVDCY